RKSVAAKPDVFESNLNLGLMLVRGNNPEAERFLRAATGLKPTAHVEEGQAPAGLLHERQKEFSAAEAEYKLVLTLDPHSTDPHGNDPSTTEAAIGLTNIY